MSLYTEEELDQILFDDITLRQHLEIEAMLTRMNIKNTAQGPEPIIDVDFNSEDLKHREILKEENKSTEKEKRDLE